jgi:UDP:flavonoid glycosyltransferase YjiC (YdhE family)
MSRILIGTMPFVGHVNPILPIAGELVTRGHDVRWFTGGQFREKIETLGARYVPMPNAVGLQDDAWKQRYPQAAAMKPLDQLRFVIKHIFIDSAVEHVHDLLAILDAEPADVILADSSFSAAGLLHESGGPPWAAFNTLPLTLSSRDTAPFGLGLPPGASALGRVRNRLLQALFERVVFKDTIEYGDRIRAGLGLPPTGRFIFDVALSPYLYLQGTVPAFEYPRSDLPPQVHFVGPSLPPPPSRFDPPKWWNELLAARATGRPVVHVTQGTVATEAGHLLAPTLRALAGSDALVVATTGGKPVDALGLDPLPANARVAPFVPHALLLPYVDAMITNAGYNGVQVALANGVPLIAAGRSEDKPEVAARIAWSGVGIDLRTSTPSEARLRRAVKTVLTDGRYRARARAMATAMAGYDAPRRSADLLERLIASGRPVLDEAASAASTATPA